MSYLRKHLRSKHPRSKTLLFSSENFIVLPLVFSSLIILI